MDRQPLPTQQVPSQVRTLLDEYRAARAAGTAPPVEELLARHPELADQLRPLLEAEAALPNETPAGSPPNPTPVAQIDVPTLDLPAPGLATLDFPPGGSSHSEQPTLAGAFVPPPQPSLCGETFGDYELLEEIARGGMGVVFKARQKSLNRVVALKMILAGQFASPEHIRRFHIEAEEAGRLAHPNIVPIYQVGEEGGQHYYSMKLIQGGNLASHLPQFTADPAAAARLIAVVARAVHDAHLHGILHRDLKPGNILLDQDGQPHVTDFGLAKHLDAGGPNSDTCSGTIVGTPAYMAPEQAAARKTLTIAADVWSLGAILYECLAGRPPFQADSPMETLMHVLDREPAPPRQHNPAVPIDLETISLKCLQKEPAKRYASGMALALDLERYLKEEPIHARPVGRAERAWKWTKRRPAAAALVAVTALALLGLLVGGWWSNARMSDANARLTDALGVADERRQEAERQTKIAEGQTRIAEAQTKEADRLRRVAVADRVEIDKRRKQALASAELARKERARAEAGFRKRIETLDDLLINLDGQLATEGRMESLRAQFLQDFLVFAKQMVDDQPGDPLARRQLGRIYGRLGDVYDTLERYPQAEQNFQLALKEQKALVKEAPGRAEYRADLALTYYQYAQMLRYVPNYPAATRAFAEGIKLQDELARQHPATTAYAARAVRMRFSLGNMLERAQQPSALKAYREAVDRQERLVAAAREPEALNYLGLIADSLGSMQEASRPAEALRWLGRSIKARREARDKAPDGARYSRDLRESYTDFGAFLLKHHRHAELARLSDQLCDDFSGSGDTYDAACVMANAAQAARQGKDGTPEERSKLADGYAARAVKLLDKAIQLGYSNRAHMDKDSDLDALRDRADYRKLMANLDAKLPAQRPLTVAEQLKAITDDYSASLGVFNRKFDQARTVAQTRRAQASRPDFDKYADKVLAFAEKHKDDPAAVDALHWVLYRSDPAVARSLAKAREPKRQRALELLARDHLDKPDLSEICRQLATLAGPATDKLLAAIQEKHKKKDQRAIALFALGLSLAKQSQRVELTDPPRSRELARRAEDKLARIVRDHADVPLSKSTLGEMARKKLNEVKHLSVGCPALEILGAGLDGKPLKLSDHKGKVVLLDFWANWCGYCRAQYPHRRELAARLKGKPVVMLGVNSDDDKATVQSVVAKHKIPGSHWWDGGGVSGRVSDRWQIDGLPTVYVLDHRGVIRFKGQLRPEEVDRYVDQLLKELAREKGSGE